jgi:hypothetical protein
MSMRHRPAYLALLYALLFPLTSSAENSQDFGMFVVHFNALATDLLPPKVAKEYNITRSENRGMLNITVLKKVLGTAGQPVTADVEASAANLTGQIKKFKMREVHDGTAIYYIGEFGVTNEEILNFDVKVRPEGESAVLNVRFRQEFYTR